jgi:Flp pilus assembly protein protease CpaA
MFEQRRSSGSGYGLSREQTPPKRVDPRYFHFAGLWPTLRAMSSGATEVEHPGTPASRANRRRFERTIALVVAAVLVGLTFAAVHPVANAALYALVQILLVTIAAVDLETRRIPNELVAALAVLALVARAVAERSVLVESVVAGLAVFGIALLLANLARGGLGMGDVKLAGALGLVLGKVVLLALALGTAAGAIAAVAVLVRRGSAGRRTTIAYGPYLVLGASLGILVFAPPPLV